MNVEQKIGQKQGPGQKQKTVASGSTGCQLTPGQGQQMKTSLWANSGLFTDMLIHMCCP